ncbi:MAG: hypothetical protein V3R99_14075 [Thermoguttaceae bacterium]
MSIRVVCPNGHTLKVQDSFAGKVGLCPTCKARVEVPRTQDEISEDAIMGILGPHLSSDEQPERLSSRPPVQRDQGLTPKKSCHQCNRQISAAIHICPHCHTYIAKLADF